jgi:biopolymer transport protein ExbB/TolQ
MEFALVGLPLPASVVYAFKSSDNFARFIVLLLLILSVYAWTMIVDKGGALRRLRAGDQRFRQAFARLGSIWTLFTERQSHRGTLHSVYLAGMTELDQVLKTEGEDFNAACRQGTLTIPLSETQVERIRGAMERKVSSQIVTLEHRLATLGIIVSISPFLGLLGTVWGVMMAFCSMAQQGQPDIGAMAPGVSGALLTTVVGLLVAIPAVIGYNIMTSVVRKTTMEMDGLVEEMVSLLQKEPRRTTLRG